MGVYFKMMKRKSYLILSIIIIFLLCAGCKDSDQKANLSDLGGVFSYSDQDLDFKIDRESFSAIKKNFGLIKTLANTKIKAELGKLKTEKNKINFQLALSAPDALDKIFKTR